MILDKELAEKLIKSASRYFTAAIQKDANNLYSLKADWTLPVVRGLDLRDYSDESIEIIQVDDAAVVVVKAFESTPEDPVCDGATLSPDRVFGVDFVAASVFHDVWYLHMDRMAEAWGWEVERVRKAGDQIFASIVLAENGSGRLAVALATVYYRAVRLVGGLYHGNAETVDKARRAVTIALLALLVFCAGCVGSVFDGGSEYEPPQVEKVR